MNFFPVAKNQQKTGANAPVQHHSDAIQQALKPILERFDFVKFSGFSPDFAAPRKKRRSCRHRTDPPPKLPRRPKISSEKEPERRHQCQIIFPHVSDSCFAKISAASPRSSSLPASVFHPPPPVGIFPDTPTIPVHWRYPPSAPPAAPL